ncbi:DUF1800 domain-containing protein [Roseomonas marmotae]|uniref:DUF1800 domain-containing protein n=1 Tax=Roseomonas marmotae TaxID=2768161 RepID=A0ABS3KEC3_9PROT|nr:DUF1800 domain-containing protein [Roseomonas marmotae]MBO1075805.1 DUF1800 domain-containing protein [Roseomonas marmotae]QTI80527.1 DUF1800 domain-containing protein [Roseomonas marmotae]
MNARSFQAAIRFGLGPRPDQPVPADAERWLLDQLEGPAPEPPPPAGFDHPPTVADGFRIWRERDAAPPPEPGQRTPVDTYFLAESIAAHAWRLDTPAPYRERLVDFWSNHFTISRRAGTQVSVTVPSFVRDVIRPGATGRFADMLVAAFKHPAMLGYLDQASSVGPNSRFGRRTGRGLNENLAREILELHTVSPAAGYTQQDVTEFARLLTGWRTERDREPFGTVFTEAAHEPGEKTVMGRRFGEGELAAEQALRFLAAHPATHRHLATKLARHFVADDPPVSAVARLEAVLRDTNGDLGAVSRALVQLPQAWDPPFSKLRAPSDYVTAVYRACGAGGDRFGEAAFKATAGFGQPVWSALQPNGWPDLAQDWATPEAVMQRLDWAFRLGGQFARLRPLEVLETTLGPLAPLETRQALMGAGSPQEALALLFASAEFQRR